MCCVGYISVFGRYAMCLFCNYTATPEIYTYGHTLTLHDALPIFQRPRDRLCRRGGGGEPVAGAARRHRRSNRLAGICLSEPETGFLLHRRGADAGHRGLHRDPDARGEIGRAHVWTTVTNEHLVCRLLLEKKQHNKKHESSTR